MNIYCGTDIIEVKRIKEAIQDNYKFVLNIFTKLEIKYCEVKNDEQKYIHFAGRFAAKEAIYKAISGDKSLKDISFIDIEILNDFDNNKRPYVVIKGKENIQVDVSISHIKEYATANAIVVIN